MKIGYQFGAIPIMHESQYQFRDFGGKGESTSTFIKTGKIDSYLDTFKYIRKFPQY